MSRLRSVLQDEAVDRKSRWVGRGVGGDTQVASGNEGGRGSVRCPPFFFFFFCCSFPSCALLVWVIGHHVYAAMPKRAGAQGDSEPWCWRRGVVGDIKGVVLVKHCCCGHKEPWCWSCGVVADTKGVVLAKCCCCGDMCLSAFVHSCAHCVMGVGCRRLTTRGCTPNRTWSSTWPVYLPSPPIPCRLSIAAVLHSDSESRCSCTTVASAREGDIRLMGNQGSATVDLRIWQISVYVQDI